MLVVPADAPDRLGFEAVRARLLLLTRSALGAERLAALQPSSDPVHVRRELARAGEMQALLEVGDPLPMSGLDDLRSALARLAPKNARLDGDELFAIGRLATTARRMLAFFRSRQDTVPELWRVAGHLVALDDLEAHVGRTLDPAGRVRDDASPELRRLHRELAQRQSQLRSTLQRALRAAIAEGYATEEQPTIRGGRAVIPVRVEAKRKVQGFVHDVSSTGQTVYIEPAAVLDLNNEVRETETDIRRETDRILQALSAHARAHRPDLQQNLATLAQLDAYAAIGRLAFDLDAIVPALAPDTGEGAGVLRIVRGRNPHLALHFAERREEKGEEEGEREEESEDQSPDPQIPRSPDAVVPLDLELGGAIRTLVITGPNAGGKSVALKTAGLMALMVQAGIPVPAAPGSQFPVFRRLFVDIGDQQSIQDDLSTFTSHVTNLRQMLDGEAGALAGSLVLLDEAGTGTDPAEGGALAQAVLEELTERGALTICTTHHGGLKAYAHHAPAAENGSMQFDRARLAPTYRLQVGVPGSSYAFEIAQRVGLSERTTARARVLAGASRARFEDLVAEYEARGREAETLRDEAAQSAREAEKARRRYEDRLAKLEAETDGVRQKALAEAEAVLKGANRRVEKTIREIREAEAEREATLAAREKMERMREQVGARKGKVERRVEKREARTGARTNGAAKGPKPAAPSAPAPSAFWSTISVGDQVRLDGGAVGEVMELSGKEAMLALGQIRTRVKLKRLEKVGGPRKQRIEVRAPSGAKPGMAATSARMKVDVRGQRVEAALPQVERLVDEALAAGLHRVEVLHGKGTGALRLAVLGYLQDRPDVTGFEEAEWDEGGSGVTVIDLS